MRRRLQLSIVPVRVAMVVTLLTIIAACSDPGATDAVPEPTTRTSGPSSTTSTSESTTTTSVATSTDPSSPATTSSSTTPPLTEPTSPAPTPCSVGPIGPEAGLDPFYTQGCDLDGFPVVAAESVDPEAVRRAGAFVAALFDHDPALAAELRASDVRLGVIGVNQRTTEMPEYRDLYEAFPGTDWDNRARGLGATVARPLVSAGEENLLCLPFPTDRYQGEDILLHEFAHVLHEFGYRRLDPGFENELIAAYLTAQDAGTWADTYAATNAFEYWAEGVQSYFGRNLSSPVADGVHGPIDSAEALADADPTLYALIDERLGGLTLPGGCP